MTIIVNLFGAPGAGKSTTRAGVFNLLKLSQVNCEEVTEYAKDLTWERRYGTLLCQPYVFGKQLRNMERLVGQVDVIINDSPLLLSAYYNNGRYHESFRTFVFEQFKAMGGINYFINRVKPFNPLGRVHNERQSDGIALVLKELLDEAGATYIEVDGDENAAKIIADDVKVLLKKETEKAWEAIKRFAEENEKL